ncbi:hypothetical protein KP509_06G051900 [Ceratopteris richardii]|uniref:Dirigent protein n=1 Tax=Ceratopteris richardii TaxID=49495 RepID=A0A8T2UKA2_CERRI|nr:hypothetical protein KP509_06G051900 [Ceratopteris richardii]
MGCLGPFSATFCSKDIFVFILCLHLFVSLNDPRSYVGEARNLPGGIIPTLKMYNALIIQGPNSTEGFNAVQCGGPSPALPNMFGAIFCFDMPLLKKKNLDSELLGRVQGSWTATQMTGGTIVVSETFILTNSTSLGYRGTFSGLGIEVIGQKSSKPITGGTGDFELASGVAITTPIGTAQNDSFGNAFFWFKYEFFFHN